MDAFGQGGTGYGLIGHKIKGIIISFKKRNLADTSRED